MATLLHNDARYTSQHTQTHAAHLCGAAKVKLVVQVLELGIKITPPTEPQVRSVHSNRLLTIAAPTAAITVPVQSKSTRAKQINARYASVSRTHRHAERHSLSGNAPQHHTVEGHKVRVVTCTPGSHAIVEVERPRQRLGRSERRNRAGQTIRLYVHVGKEHHTITNTTTSQHNGWNT